MEAGYGAGVVGVERGVGGYEAGEDGGQDFYYGEAFGYLGGGRFHCAKSRVGGRGRGEEGGTGGREVRRERSW